MPWCESTESQRQLLDATVATHTMTSSEEVKCAPPFLLLQLNWKAVNWPTATQWHLLNLNEVIFTVFPMSFAFHWPAGPLYLCQEIVQVLGALRGKILAKPGQEPWTPYHANLSMQGIKVYVFVYLYLYSYLGNNLKKRKMRKTEILWFLFQYVSKFEI